MKCRYWSMKEIEFIKKKKLFVNCQWVYLYIYWVILVCISVFIINPCQNLILFLLVAFPGGKYQTICRVFWPHSSGTLQWEKGRVGGWSGLSQALDMLYKNLTYIHLFFFISEVISYIGLLKFHWWFNYLSLTYLIILLGTFLSCV